MLCSANGCPGTLPNLLDCNLQNKYLGDLGQAFGFLLGWLFVSFIVSFWGFFGWNVLVFCFVLLLFFFFVLKKCLFHVIVINPECTEPSKKQKTLGPSYFPPQSITSKCLQLEARQFKCICLFSSSEGLKMGVGARFAC